MFEGVSIERMYGMDDMSKNVLSWLHYEGFRPRHYKNREYFKDHWNCAFCDAGVDVGDKYCRNCGFQILWFSSPCLTERTESVNARDIALSSFKAIALIMYAKKQIMLRTCSRKDVCCFIRRNEDARDTFDSFSGYHKDVLRRMSDVQLECSIRKYEGSEKRFIRGKYGRKYDYYLCSNCGAGSGKLDIYCHNCGTRFYEVDTDAELERILKKSVEDVFAFIERSGLDRYSVIIPARYGVMGQYIECSLI